MASGDLVASSADANVPSESGEPAASSLAISTRASERAGSPEDSFDCPGAVSNRPSALERGAFGYPAGDGLVHPRPPSPDRLAMAVASEGASPLVPPPDPAGEDYLPIALADASGSHRRLRRKTSVSTALDTSGASDSVAEPTSWAASSRGDSSALSASSVVRNLNWPSQPAWDALPQKRRYNFIYDHVRNHWARQQHLSPVLDGNVLGEPAALGASDASGGRARDLRSRFTRLSLPVKRKAADAWIAEHADVPEHIAWSAAFMWTSEKEKLRYCGNTALLTYIGPWGLRNDAGEWQSMPDEFLDISTLTEFLRKAPDVLDLWKRATARVQELQQMFATDSACCMEVCTETLAVQRCCRIHLHVFLRATERLRLPPSRLLTFEDVTPQMSAVVGGMGLQRKSNSWSGFFYCVVPKIGQIFSHGTRRPFKDFLVDAKWITNLLQAGKISPQTARECFVQTVNGAKRNCEEIAFLERAEEESAVRVARQRALQALQTTNAPFRTFALVEEWQRQYAQLDWRYKFLVLVGPSRTGKTQLARSLAGPTGGLAYEINCASGSEPDLRGFRFSRHGLILYDEVHPAQVAAQRLLFQAGTTLLSLGCSNTNCHSYTVYVHKVRMVLCSNTWTKELEDLTPEDREWIAANSVEQMINEPCWATVEPPSLPPVCE